MLQDPTWERSGHTVKGRDGCRVPIPWSGSQSPFGFGPSGTPWLPQPAHWSSLSVAAQTDDPGSHLNLYRTALAERRRNPALGDGDLTWREGEHTDLLVFDREPGFRCMVNFGAPVALPEGAEVLVHSGEAASGKLGTDEAVWLKV